MNKTNTTQITPFLMFEGKAEEAMNFYISLFPEARVISVGRSGPGEAGKEGTILRADFSLAGQTVICIDSPVKHDFTFTPAMSLFVDCTTDSQLETLFTKLSTGGQVMMPLDNYGFSRRFGWVSDRFGVSWQLNLPNE
jgi:predicted 3-demethylubiquinone-9 3-methyltransferase (glyoxalase superfamily)